MAKRFNVHIEYNDTEEIMEALRQRELYSSDSLYRVLTIEDDVSTKVRDILRKGTDRTSDMILGSEDDGYFNLMDSEDERLAERGRPLNPSEYLWLVEEDGLHEQLSKASPNGDLFVSVYNPKKMLPVNNDFCFEFADKERPQDSLVALVQLHYR